MKVIVAGSRWIEDEQFVFNAIKRAGFHINEIVHGGAKGVDSLAQKYAESHQIPVKVFPADWEKYGDAAGPIRNAEMAKYADALVAVWDGKSAGTSNMIDLGVTNDLSVRVFMYEKRE